MESFLKHIALDLYTRYKENISTLCLVFPNRRASLYFKKYLSEITDKPVWAPESITINQLVQEISGLKTADNIQLLFELYKIYRRVKKTDESFDSFYYWGEMMLNDFDDIDKYLVNPEDLFKNLKSLKSIQDQFTYLTPEQISSIKKFWESFDLEKQSKHQNDFISIWNVLNDIYVQFNQKLQELEIAYEGMTYRKLVEMIQSDQNINLPHSKYVFIGFNALNNCEKKLFKYLQNNGLAEFYWDYDQYYIQNEHHEAGFFLRENIKEFKSPASFVNQDILNSLSHDKNIEIISTPSDIGQAKTITGILKKNSDKFSESPDNTAIVLGDESHLIPVLHSIPDLIKQVNITMGYPVDNTPIYSLLEHVIDLQKNIKESGNEIKFYHKNVISILNHQYINTLYKKEANSLLKIIREKNKIVISRQELAVSEFFNIIFSKKNSFLEYSVYLLDILHHIYIKLQSKSENDTIHTASLEKEYIYHIYLAINRVKDVLNEQNIEIGLDTFTRLIRKFVKNMRIPFTGEPLSGLQIMGILETRLLDFENLIITSLNEGIFPKTEASLSFIPYNLRRGFGLPTIEHQDSIYAYYFYRLIQRARNITLIYNSSTEGLQTGEMSRFLYQLKYETTFNIKETSLRYDISVTQPKEIQIEKTAEVIQRFDQYLISKGGSKYISPSALNTYMRCSLQFYFRYIAGLRKQEDIAEEIDAPLFGNILHEAMDFLYQDYLNKELSLEELKLLEQDKEKIQKAIDHAFTKEYFKGDKTDYTGKNIIIHDIIERYVYQIIKIDQDIAPFKLISLEDKYEVEIPVNINGEINTIKLGGKIDRVDIRDNHLRIIDYKTGGDKLEFKNIESLFSDKKNDRKDAVFQTFVYAFLYSKLKNPELPITPGVYSVRKSFESNFDCRIRQKENRTETIINRYDQVSNDFKEKLVELIQAIFNPHIPFTQTKEKRDCEYCDFKKFCHR